MSRLRQVHIFKLAPFLHSARGRLAAVLSANCQTPFRVGIRIVFAPTNGLSASSKMGRQLGQLNRELGHIAEQHRPGCISATAMRCCLLPFESGSCLTRRAGTPLLSSGMTVPRAVAWRVPEKALICVDLLQRTVRGLGMAFSNFCLTQASRCLAS